MYLKCLYYLIIWIFYLVAQVYNDTILFVYNIIPPVTWWTCLLAAGGRSHSEPICDGRAGPVESFTRAAAGLQLHHRGGRPHWRQTHNSKVCQLHPNRCERIYASIIYFTISMLSYSFILYGFTCVSQFPLQFIYTWMYKMVFVL